MASTNQKQQSFAQARQDKRLIFQTRWNCLLNGPQLLAANIFYTAAQLLFFLFSGGFILDQALLIGLIASPTPGWQKLMILSVQILLSLPGFACCAGLWRLRKKSRWEEGITPDISGLRWMRITNFAVIFATGAALALYPTVIIGVGEYFREESVTRIFYLFLGSSLLLILSATLIRIVLRGAEENISCCWSDTRCVLALILVLIAALLAILIWAPLKKLFFIAAGLVVAANLYVLAVYLQFLKTVGKIQAEIDRAVIASRENPDDPYNRYENP